MTANEPKVRIRIQWTTTAKECLKQLPLKVRKGLLSKADDLIACDDPRRVHKPLVGPLQGYYRITYGRYRAIFRVEEDTLANGDVLINLTVQFIAAGIRKEQSRDDVYRVAQKIVQFGVLPIDSPEKPE